MLQLQNSVKMKKSLHEKSRQNIELCIFVGH